MVVATRGGIFKLRIARLGPIEETSGNGAGRAEI